MVKELSYKNISECAKQSYNHEPGRKKAIDEGIMTIKDLEIYFYINTWTGLQSPSRLTPDEEVVLYYKNLPRAYEKAAKMFKINSLEAKTIFEKVKKIPKTLK
jgi:hypothetical protein